MVIRQKSLTLPFQFWKCPNGGIGRRVGLKIQCPLKTCRFEPGFGHPTEVSLVFLGDFFFFLSDSTLRLLPSTFGRRKRAEVSLKRAVLHPWATKMYESVAQVSRAAPSGNDKYGFRCRRVSFIHTSFCPAPLGNGKARKSRLTVPRVTFGCGTVRRHRSRRARRRPLLLSLEGFRGVGRMVVRPLYRPLYPAYSFDIWKFLLFLS